MKRKSKISNTESTRKANMEGYNYSTGCSHSRATISKRLDVLRNARSRNQTYLSVREMRKGRMKCDRVRSLLEPIVLRINYLWVIVNAFSCAPLRLVLQLINASVPHFPNELACIQITTTTVLC